MAKSKPGERTVGSITKRVVLPTATALVVGYGGFAENMLDLSGDLGHDRSHEAMRAIADGEIRSDFRAADAAGKFAMMYLSTRTTTVGEVEGSAGFARVFASMGSSNGNYIFGQECLAGSAYDIRSSAIRGFSNGDISAVAALSIEGTSVSIHPAGSEAPPLHFTIGEDGTTLSADAGTQDTLAGYGCDAEVVTPLVVVDGYYS
jgi:hypothetical protein